MKKLVLCMAALATLMSATAQENKNDKPQKVKVTPYGFVRNYFNYDSRATYTVCGGEYNMQPLDESWNMSETEAAASGLERVDLNANPQAHLLALTTRIGLNLQGPDVWGAATSGKIEGDFAGFSTTNNVFRIRHAYLKLNWADQEANQSQELLVGQTWHPLVGEIMPEVLGMAAGAPFRPHSRTPQARFIHYFGNLGYTVAAVYQLQYMNQGPQDNGGSWGRTNSTSFANNAVVPEMFVGVNYKSNGLYLQLGGDFQTIRPRTYGYATGLDLNDYKVDVDETVFSFTPTLYAQYTQGRFAVKARTMLAENTSHLNMLMSGYAVTAMNADGSWEYTPLRNSTSYINFAYTLGKEKRYRADLFFGYMKNLGLADANASIVAKGDGTANANYVYCKGNYTNINSFFRVAPSISYNLKHFNVGLEYEYNLVSYGTLQTDGTVSADRGVVGHRICALMKYNF